MKLATYLAPGTANPRVGIVRPEEGLIHPLPAGMTMRALIDGGRDNLDRLAAKALAEPGRPLAGAAGVRLLPPLEPASVRDFVAFEEHVEGVRRSIDGVAGVPEAWYDAPTFYFSNPHRIIGPDDEAVFPATCEARDFELEVAVIVGGEGRSVTTEQARDLVFGYTLLNDWSARDLQGREMQVNLGPAKGKDFATTLGPWIVTADELEPHRDRDGFLDLGCRVTVNGEEIGSDLLSNIGWTFEALIAYASRDSRVVAGDVLGSGTVGHGGCLGELWGRHGTQAPPPLQPGDVVTIEVDGIGSVTNTVAVAPPAPALPAVRRRDQAAARAAHAAGR